MRKSTDNGRLTPRQQKAILALLTEANLREAARAVPVPERTLYAWTRKPAFAAAYRDARSLAVSQAVGRLQHYSSAAASVLLRVMAEPSTPASVRVIAAGKVM